MLMIFHTTCDPVYFERFYDKFRKSILNYNSQVRFSLNYVGPKNEEIEKYCLDNNIVLENEEISYDKLKIKFCDSSENDILGYYPLCRWKSIPDINESVIVCDVDIMCIGSLNIPELENILHVHQALNITRKKPKGTNGGMMLIGLSNNAVKAVKEYAINHSLSLSSKISIAQDVNIRTFIYNSFNVYEINNKMLDLTKPKYQKSDEWFAFSKGGQGQDSIKKLEKLTNNLKSN